LTTVAAFIAVLALVAAPAAIAGQLPDVTDKPEINTISNDVTIAIGKNGLNASFEKIPLRAVLVGIARQADFEFVGDARLLDRLVSFKFDGVPVTEAIKTMLKPFSYVIVHGPEAGIERVLVLGARTGPPIGEVVQPRSAGSQANHRPDSLFDSDLTLEQRLMFEEADQKLEPPPELRDDGAGKRGNRPSGRSGGGDQGAASVRASRE
jgi:hypothetical protein